jgi:hypothetical protein
MENTRIENEIEIDSRLRNRRSSDMDVVMHMPDNYYTINGELREKNLLVFNKWYTDSAFNKQTIKVKKLMRLFNKRVKD